MSVKRNVGVPVERFISQHRPRFGPSVTAYDCAMAESDPVAAAPERAAGLLVLGAATVAVISGIALAFAYRPSDYGWLRTLHSGSAAVTVVSAIAARVVRRGGRLKMAGSMVPKVIGLVFLVGGAFATGATLAWTGGEGGDRGMFLASGHRVAVSGQVVTSSGLIVSFVAHLALGLCAVVLLGAVYVRRWCRPRPTDRRRSTRPPGRLKRNSGTSATR